MRTEHARLGSYKLHVRDARDCRRRDGSRDERPLVRCTADRHASAGQRHPSPHSPLSLRVIMHMHTLDRMIAHQPECADLSDETETAASDEPEAKSSRWQKIRQRFRRKDSEAE